MESYLKEEISRGKYPQDQQLPGKHQFISAVIGHYKNAAFQIFYLIFCQRFLVGSDELEQLEHCQEITSKHLIF